MKLLRHHIERLRNVRRSEHHPLIYAIHKKHKVSKRTLFYVKEYGPHSHVARTILRESVTIVLLTSIISALGGFTLERIKPLFVQIIPLIMMLPVLNDMIGDYGIIISSRFSTMLHEGRIKKDVWSTKILRVLFTQMIIVASLSAIVGMILSMIVSGKMGYNVGMLSFLKLLLIIIIDVILLIFLLFATSVIAGCYFYYKHEDPNNFLIPISTAIADFGNMALLSFLIVLFF